MKIRKIEFNVFLIVVTFVSLCLIIIKSKIEAGRSIVLELMSVKPHTFMINSYKYVDYNEYLWFKAINNWVGQGIYLN